MIDFQPLASSSKGNAYLVSDGTTRLLLEAGLPVRQLKKKTGYQLSSLTACLVTHEHQDHAKAVRDLLSMGIDCYMSQGTAQALGASGHRLHILKSRQQVQIGSWTVLPFQVVHDANEPLGFLLASKGEKLLFATDTHYIPYLFRGITHLAVECNFDGQKLKENVYAGRVHPDVAKKLWKRHLSLQNLKNYLKVLDISKVKEIYLLHLSDANSDEVRFREEIESLTQKKVCVCGG